MLKVRLLLFIICTYAGAYGQSLVRVSGRITDELNNPLSKVTIAVLGQKISSVSDEKGAYAIYSPATSFTIKYTLLGYKPVLVEIKRDKGGAEVQHVTLTRNINELEQVTITTKQNQLSNSTVINVNDVAAFPSASGNFEVILKTLPGVSTNNELSSQYSVRGGNFDENLIYVNDVEINRPVLIRNGQQEGLSFINSDLLTTAKFSAGGFEAKYGDKLSSVLDVSYDKPDSSQATLNVGMLGAYFSSKTLTTNSYLLTGLRYKNNSSLLSRQDDKGTYAPNFMDAQVIYHQDLSSRVGVNLLASFNSGTFKLTPESRETQFGTSSTLMKLQTDYAGQEIDDYQTAGAAVTLSYTPQSTSVFKWINSYFTTLERERIDIEGRYVLSGRNGSLEDLTDEEGNTKSTIGGYANYARNNLESRYFSSELKLDKYYNSHTFSAGWRFEQKKYDDELYEYSLIDSGEDVSQGGTVNYYQDNLIDVQNRLTIRYYTGYIQDSYQISANTDLQLGVRTNYNSLSNQFLVSPRLLMAYRPESNTKIFRFSAGIYQQAPDYRSIRGFDGRLQLNQKAQRSYNTSVGLDYAFDGLGTRLKFTSELYFKYQDRLIPYMMDNVRIKYLAGEVAQGYTYGTDFTIGGEFVKDLLSYFRISFMNASQDIRYDSKGSFRRPTDQRVNFSIYFQDRLLNSPNYKVHLNLLFGSKLPLGAPLVHQYSDSFGIPAYKRVDIGFSKDFLENGWLKQPGRLNKYFSSLSAHLEVFNLLDMDNTVSYLWLKDMNNVQYAIPNYLTGRRLNVKVIIKFKNSNR